MQFDLKTKLFFIMIGFSAFFCLNSQPKNEMIFTLEKNVSLIESYYNLNYHLNISHFFENLEKIQKCYGELEAACHLLPIPHDCMIKLALIYNERNQIKADLWMIEKMRKKRAIGPIIKRTSSNILKIITIENLPFNKKTIRALNQMDEFDKKLTKIQLDISKEGTEIFKNAFANFSTEINWLNKKVEEINNGTTSDSITTQILQAVYAILSQLNLFIYQIKEIVNDHSLFEITRIIGVNRIRDDVKRIKNIISKDKDIPIDISLHNIHKLLKLCKIETKLYNETVHINISVPIIKRKLFMLYKPIPIPTIKNNMVQIIRTNKTIIVDNFFEELLTITNKDLEKCTEKDTHHVVCRFVDMAIEPIDKCIWNSFPLKKQ